MILDDLRVLQWKRVDCDVFNSDGAEEQSQCCGNRQGGAPTESRGQGSVEGARINILLLFVLGGMARITMGTVFIRQP